MHRAQHLFSNLQRKGKNTDIQRKAFFFWKFLHKNAGERARAIYVVPEWKKFTSCIPVAPAGPLQNHWNHHWRVHVFLLNPNRSSRLGDRAQQKKPDELSPIWFQWFCGKRGIRTPEPLQVNGFQDRRDRPLRHLSKKHLCMQAAWSITRLSEAFSSNAGAKIRAFSEIEKSIPTFSQKSCLSSFVRLTERAKKKAAGRIRQPSGIFITWQSTSCAWQESNLHELLHWILSPARLPIPPQAHTFRATKVRLSERRTK